MDKALLDFNPLGDSEPFSGETLVADGWKYQDFNPMLAEYWDDLLSLIGEGNYRLLTPVMERTFPGDRRLFKRAQILIAPAGLERVRAHVAAKHQ